MVFVSNKNPSFQTWLAIQFSETDHRRRAFSSSPSAVFAVEGCCLYGMTFRSSTVIEKFSPRPAARLQCLDLPGLFRRVFFAGSDPGTRTANEARDTTVPRPGKRTA